ncbi:hypothetical protein [Pseudactinotalea sp.]|uniref:hypothetical protein n=1 Tax=Pseudactinotalea sp. TaxID=1926260 RepID=UPI003B3AFB2F
MLDPHWVFLSATLSLVGSVHYATATVRGRARPNLVTWALWATAPTIGFFAQLDSGVGLPAILTLAAGVGPLIVLVAAVLSRHHHARVGPFDLACGAIAVVALVAWWGLEQAPVAVLLAVGADAAAALPTIRKAWREPESENAAFYVMVAAGALVTLLTITCQEPQDWAFAVYIFALSTLLAGVTTSRRRRSGRG